MEEPRLHGRRVGAILRQGPGDDDLARRALGALVDLVIKRRTQTKERGIQFGRGDACKRSLERGEEQKCNKRAVRRFHENRLPNSLMSTFTILGGWARAPEAGEVAVNVASAAREA